MDEWKRKTTSQIEGEKLPRVKSTTRQHVLAAWAVDDAQSQQETGEERNGLAPEHNQEREWARRPEPKEADVEGCYDAETESEEVQGNQ